MKINSEVQISGNKVVLVPYRRSHVLRYHEWMENETLRELTASERLTLEEEYEMQQSWLHDDDKCTFIVLEGQKFLETNNEIASMIGDVNIYLNYSDSLKTGELGMMISEQEWRGQGFGKEAVTLMMRYGLEALGIEKYITKISLSNKISIEMFKKFNFVEECRNEIFQEITLSRKCDSQFIDWLKKNTPVFIQSKTVTNS